MELSNPPVLYYREILICELRVDCGSDVLTVALVVHYTY